MRQGWLNTQLKWNCLHLQRKLCSEGLYYDSTSNCVQCQKGFPSYDQSTCLDTCDQGGQILNLNGTACIYKENCTQLISQNNNTTQCISNCNSNRQFVDLNNQTCYTCSGDTSFINYDDSKKNGTCVSKCNEGLYYNSTSYCLQCQKGFPSYDQSTCFETCDKGGQILNLNGTACIYKENCTQLISQNNNTTQCISNCNSNRQFVDLNNQTCYTCSADTPFINYDDSKKNGTCVSKCNEGLYYNSTNYCLQCQKGFPSYDQSSCLDTCDKGGQILNLNGTACIYKENCTQLFAQTNATTQCVDRCSEGLYYDSTSNCVQCQKGFPSYDQSTCLDTCDQGGQILNLNGTACIYKENCTQLISQNNNTTQ
ncbi:zinc finger lsd1 subclass family protein, partial (macronuclear) [Tetrahymena thermophila SB210]